MAKKKVAIIPTEIIPSVSVTSLTPREVSRRFAGLLNDGATLTVDGQGRKNPTALPKRGYTPKYEVDLFQCRYFLCNKRDADGLKVLPAFVMPNRNKDRKRIYARVFYKDSSLVWRSASHYINTPEEQWIGKGAVKRVKIHGSYRWVSAEETTDLPFELQAALDDVSRRGPRSRNDHQLLSLVLRNAPADRVWPYRDFEGPREKAMSASKNRINNNQSIAWFAEHGKPESLQFEPGFEPDFAAIVDSSDSRSTMYGGDIKKYRIASKNRQVQYLFVKSPTHTWIVNPQSFTSELSSYGLRTVDVVADEDFSIPGYEFADNNGDGHTEDQIPAGFVGAPCPFDNDRADASPWNHRLPVITAFHKAIGAPTPSK
ncbi:MAG: hypothetical protein HKM98_03325 [Gammaproteobacteria bacterium]|nr:hypothetical protein [Gammaproteobacteria bacterium]